MTDPSEFAASIRASPSDGLPRKVFADWLEERGDADLANVVRTFGTVGPARIGDGGGDDGGGGGGKKTLVAEGLDMKDGLHLVVMPGGWSPYVLIGWAVREDLFIRLRNCRVVRRFGGHSQLATLAKKGPVAKTELLDASEEEFLCVTNIVRAIPCDPKKWAKECPEPK